MRLNRSPKPDLVARFRRVVNSAFRRQRSAPLDRRGQRISAPAA